MAYAIASELRGRINKSSITDDSILTSLIAAAENNINTTCNRPDGFEADTTASARIYSGGGKPYIVIDECVAITLVGAKESSTDSTYTSWVAGDWIAFRGSPKNPNFNGLPYTAVMVAPGGNQAIFTGGGYGGLRGFRPDSDFSRGVPTVQITAKWGYSVTPPADIKEACLMQAARWYKRFEGAMGDALASGELGMILYRQALDPDIRRILIDGRYLKPVTGGR